MSKDYTDGFKNGFVEGFRLGRELSEEPTKTIQYCKVCGISMDAWYAFAHDRVCIRLDCPNKITSINTIHL